MEVLGLGVGPKGRMFGPRLNVGGPWSEFFRPGAGVP